MTSTVQLSHQRFQPPPGPIHSRKIHHESHKNAPFRRQVHRPQMVHSRSLSLIIQKSFNKPTRPSSKKTTRPYMIITSPPVQPVATKIFNKPTRPSSKKMTRPYNPRRLMTSPPMQPVATSNHSKNKVIQSGMIIHIQANCFFFLKRRGRHHRTTGSTRSYSQSIIIHFLGSFFICSSSR